MTHRRTLLVAVLAGAACLVPPDAAPAATAAVTADDGTAIPLTAEGAATIRTMAPAVMLAFEPGEVRYEVEVTGPGGTVAGAAGGCRPVAAGEPGVVPVAYAGNGTYTVRWRATAAEDCAAAGEPRVATFSVAAYAAVSTPRPLLLTRRPFETHLTAYRFPVDANPGAVATEVLVARDAVPTPDGPIAAGAEHAMVEPDAAEARVRFARPGTYALVARAVSGGTAAVTSPWSPPATVRVLSPFDFVGKPSFSDDRGPRYRVEGVVREATARGRIAVALRRKGGRLRSLGRVRIRSGGRFSVRFTARRPGRYELRYRFRGSATTAPGTVLLGIRIA